MKPARAEMPPLPCEGEKCQPCRPLRVPFNSWIARTEHEFLKAEAKRRAMTLTGVLRELIRDDMRRKGCA